MSDDAFLKKYENHITVTRQAHGQHLFMLSHEDVQNLPEFDAILSFANTYSAAIDKVELSEDTLAFPVTGVNITFLQHAVITAGANIAGDLIPRTENRRS